MIWNYLGIFHWNKIRTAVPENLKTKTNFQDEIGDFLGDPLIQPLPKVNAFSKHKSEMVRPIGGMKSFGSINMSQKENKAASEADATKKVIKFYNNDYAKI